MGTNSESLVPMLKRQRRCRAEFPVVFHKAALALNRTLERQQLHGLFQSGPATVKRKLDGPACTKAHEVGG
jgi:hypothetical protein